MANLKSLFKDTAVYGLSSIIGRFLNYLLVPLYTHVIAASSGGYGVVTNLYAYTALILVLLTFGMETTFFRFANKEEENPHCVFSTAVSVIVTLTALFLTSIILFIAPIGEALGYEKHHEYILLMAACVAIDAIQAIPFSYLRYKKKAIKFATLKLLFIFMNIGLNLMYFLVLPKLGHWEVTIFNHSIDLCGASVLGVFALNLLCTAFITIFFIPEFAHEHVAARKYCKDRNIPFKIVDFKLLRRMLSYSWPILILGIAGILNQTVDKMIFPLVYPDKTEGVVQLGIYGACVKIAMIMAMITQAFRYAYEPIVFAKSKDGDSKEYYASAMKFFIIFTLLAFLFVNGYLPLLQRILGEEYRDGLAVVPIVMVAEIMMGVYFNLSFWYKLIDQTIWGALFSFIGCAALIVFNVLFIPRMGYMACAWGGVVGYGLAMITSFIIGQKKNPINYPLRSIGGYVLLGAALFAAMKLSPVHSGIIRILINSGLILVFIAYLIKKDMPLRTWPLIGKLFR